MSSLDLSLPSKSPTESYHDQSHSFDKIAVYTLVDLDEDDINALINFIQNDDETLENVTCLPPKYNFTDGSLRDVYGYHLKLDKQRSLHPTLLIVAHHQDYEKNGVLLVNLDTDLECSVDICRLKASDAVLVAVNLMIANTDWEEVKDEELPLPSSDGNTQGKDDSDSRKVGSTPPDPSQACPASHSIFGAYTTAGADMTDIRACLEPQWSKKDPKTYLCESVGSYTDFPDPWHELIKHHPWNCRRNPRLHRQWFICADTKDPMGNGVLLVHMDWDGNITRDPDELLRIGLDVVVDKERSSVEKAVATLSLKES